MQANPYEIRAEVWAVSGLGSKVVAGLFVWLNKIENLPPPHPQGIELDRTTVESWVLAGWHVSDMATTLRVSCDVMKQLLHESGFPDPSIRALKRWSEASGLRCCSRCSQVKSLATDFEDRPKGPQGKREFCLACAARPAAKPRIPQPDPRRLTIPREKIEPLIQAGLGPHRICITLDISRRGLKRLLRDYGLSVRTRREEVLQREAQGLRRCTECKQTKSLETDFGTCHTGRLGKNARCRNCLNANGRKFNKLRRLSAKATGAPPPAAPGERDWRRCRDCRQRKSLLTGFDFDPKGPRHRSKRCLECLAALRERASIRQARKDLAAIGLQLCPACEEVKNLEADFWFDRREQLGRKKTCRQCQNQATKLRLAQKSGSAESAPAQPPPSPLEERVG